MEEVGTNKSFLANRVVRNITILTASKLVGVGVSVMQVHIIWLCKG